MKKIILALLCFSTILDTINAQGIDCPDDITNIINEKKLKVGKNEICRDSYHNIIFAIADNEGKVVDLEIYDKDNKFISNTKTKPKSMAKGYYELPKTATNALSDKSCFKLFKPTPNGWVVVIFCPKQ